MATQAEHCGISGVGRERHPRAPVGRSRQAIGLIPAAGGFGGRGGRSKRRRVPLLIDPTRPGGRTLLEESRHAFPSVGLIARPGEAAVLALLDSGQSEIRL